MPRSTLRRVMLEEAVPRPDVAAAAPPAVSPVREATTRPTSPIRILFTQ